MLSIPELLGVDSCRGCFETVSKHALCFEPLSVGRSSNIHQHPRVCPPLPPRFFSAQRNPTVPFINVKSHNFPNFKCRKNAELCRLTRFCPNTNTPKQLPYLQLRLQAWTVGVSRFVLGFIWQQLSKFLPLLQALHKLKSCCWTVGDSASGAST